MSVLDQPCLVLNRHWQPVIFWPVRSAIEGSMRGQASVLDVKHYLLYSFDEWMELEQDQLPENTQWIKTPSGQIPAPEVVVLKHYSERPPRKVGFSRLNLAKRDDFTCQYCGEKIDYDRTTVEHILPRSRGGPTTWENCVAACKDCNTRKRNLTPQEAKMPLRKVPTAPAFKLGLWVPNNEVIRPSWRPFLEKEAVA